MHEVTIDPEAQTVRPQQPGGDDFYGLASGSNGTAAKSRRECVAPASYTWLRHDGRTATGLLLEPRGRGDSRWVCPWDGPRSTPSLPW